jgi:hypothetical protein
LPGEWEVTATIRRRGEDDVKTTFTVPLRSGGDGEERASEESDSIWTWPFEGARSIAAIVVLAIAGAGVAGWGGLTLARRTGSA